MDNNLTSPQHPYPWAHPSALATAVQPAHPSEIPTISNGPIIGWPVSHGTLSTSAVRYRRTNTLKGLQTRRPPSLVVCMMKMRHQRRRGQRPRQLTSVVLLSHHRCLQAVIASVLHPSMV